MKKIKFGITLLVYFMLVQSLVVNYLYYNGTIQMTNGVQEDSLALAVFEAGR